MPVPIREWMVTLGVFALSAGLVKCVALYRSPVEGESGKREGADAFRRPGGDDVTEALNEAMAGVVERTLPGVVSVNVDRRQVITETWVSDLGPLSRERTVRQPGVGSGVIVSADGLVLTNWHVVEGEDVLILVTLHGNEEPRKAVLVDQDESMDLALLRIEPRDGDAPFLPLKFGDSDLMRPGHFVFAVGAPLNLPETVTQGIISNRSRRVSDTLDAYLQTDCTINPGNSGGPLVNLKGELIGINTRLVIGPQESPPGQAYGLAIPSNEVQDAYDRMIHKGRPRGYLGVTVDDWPVASYQTGSKPECVVVVGVDQGSPAAEAGLQKEDLIRSLNGEPVRSSSDFFRHLRKRAVGEFVVLEIARGGKPQKVQAKVMDLKSVFEAEEVPPSRWAGGMKVRSLRRAERAKFPVVDQGGVLVEEVDPRSPVQGKITAGDLILRLTGEAAEVGNKVQDLEDFVVRMELLLKSGGYLDVLRHGTVEKLTLPPIGK